MKFLTISIKNFRNFENINIDLNNKNVFFGMNDVGKTNFLYALRYLFDREIRKKELIESDFYQKNTNKPIEIIVSIDISDETDSDSEKIRAKVKGALLSEQDTVYIKLFAEYNRTEMRANPVLYWGGDIGDLQEIKSRGYTFELDNVFNVIYIDAYVDLYGLFRRNTPILLKNDDDADKNKLEFIDKTINKLNKKISSLSGVKKFEKEVTPRYKKVRQDQVEVVIKSEISINGLYSNVAPYIKRTGTEELYPTSGEGRKKLLVYAIFDILAKESEEKKINLFLIEEPENHLHRAMQMALSHRIFVDEKYKYVFMTTHSSYVLIDMDKVNLVRIFNESKINSASSFYEVPRSFEKQKKQLNKGLVEAIFADKVLLVEGPSEEILFDKVLSTLNPFYQIDGIYILVTNGIDFKPYVDILKNLKIPFFLKTDNDLKKAGKKVKYSPIGFSRINKIIGETILPTDSVDGNKVEDKRKLYDKNRVQLDHIRDKYHIFLSRVSLEEDLDEVLHDKLNEYLPKANGNPIAYLKDHKKYNMIELVNKIKRDDCKKISSHYNFACLEEILK